LSGVLERLKQVRKHLGFSQDDIAEWFPRKKSGHLSGASWGRKERGIEHGLEPEMLRVFIEKTKIDARYLFGQINDLRFIDKGESSSDTTAAILQLQKTVQEKIPSAAKNDPDYDAFAKKEIRDIVRLLKPLDATVLNRILGFVEALSGTEGVKEPTGTG
jgi:hypothetical protein